MKKSPLARAAAPLCACALFVSIGSAQVGQRFPSEKKLVIDPVTGTPLSFLTSSDAGDSKIYQTPAGLDLRWPMGNLPLQSGARAGHGRQRGTRRHRPRHRERLHGRMLCVADRMTLMPGTVARSSNPIAPKRAQFEIRLMLWVIR